MEIFCGSALNQLRTVSVHLLPARGSAAKLGCECIYKSEMWLQMIKYLIYFWTKVSLPPTVCTFFLLLPLNPLSFAFLSPLHPSAPTSSVPSALLLAR